jgi:hypothetical protein
MVIKPVLRTCDDMLLRMLIASQIAALIDGTSGIGKSLAAHYIAEEVYAEICPRHKKRSRNKDAVCICHPFVVYITENTEVHHLVGEINYVHYLQDTRNGKECNRLDYFEPGPLLIAMREGRAIIIEELDRAGRPGLFPLLFSVTQDRKLYVADLGEEVGASPTFTVIITVNRQTDIGVVQLPEALLGRLRVIHLYDPTRYGFDAVDARVGDANRPLRDMAFDFERKILAANSSEFYPRWSTGDDHKLCPDGILSLIYAARGALRAAQMGALQYGRISPRECAAYLSDMLRCAPRSLLRGDARQKHEVLRLFVGSLVKDEETAAAVAHVIDQRFLKLQPPFDGC